MLYSSELTDTFGGQANYCWVHRATFEAPENASSRMLLARAKKALSTNYRFSKTFDSGDLIRFDSPKCCVCLFISPDHNG